MKKFLVFVFLFMFSFSSVLAQDRFIIGTGDANNTVIDTNTGLMWERAPNLHSQTFVSAEHYCLDLDSFGGYSDWRLPNVTELLTLVDWRFKNPSISNSQGTSIWIENDSFYKINTILPVWSSTFVSNLSSSAWVVYFSNGAVDFFSKSYSNGWAWCVRGNISLIEKEIVYVNNTVYLNNCADKNISVLSSTNKSSGENISCDIANKKTPKPWLVFGLFFSCLIILILISINYYLYRKSRLRD